MLEKIKRTIYYDLTTEKASAEVRRQELAREGFTIKENPEDNLTGFGKMVFVQNIGKMIRTMTVK